MQKKIFVSFSHDDIDLVRHVVENLKKTDVEVFVDYINVRGGDSFTVYMREKIRACDYFLLIWSKSAAQSKWVSTELQLMKTRMEESPGENLKIIPFRYEELNLSSEIDTTHAITFQSFKEGMIQLFNALELDPALLSFSNMGKEEVVPKFIPVDLIKNLKNGNCLTFVGKDIPEGINSQLKDCVCSFDNNIFLSEQDEDFWWGAGRFGSIFINEQLIANASPDDPSETLCVFILGYSREKTRNLLNILEEEYLVNCSFTSYAAFFTNIVNLPIHETLGADNIIRSEIFPDDLNENYNIFINHLRKRLKIQKSVFVISDFENWIEERKIVKTFVDNKIDTRHLRDCPTGEDIEKWVQNEISESDILLYIPPEFPIFTESHLSINNLILLGIKKGCTIVKYNRFNISDSFIKEKKVEDNILLQSLFLNNNFDSPFGHNESAIAFKKKYAIDSSSREDKNELPTEQYLKLAVEKNYHIPFDAITDRIFISKEALQEVENANRRVGKFDEDNPNNLDKNFLKAKLEYSKLLRFRGDWGKAISLLTSIFDSRHLMRRLRNNPGLHAQYFIEYGALIFESGLIKNKRIEGIGSIENGLRILKSKDLDVEFVKVLKQLGNLYREQGDLDNAKNLINSSKYLIQVLIDNHLTPVDKKDRNAQKIIYLDAMREYANLLSSQDENNEAEEILHTLVDEMSSYKITDLAIQDTIKDVTERVFNNIIKDIQNNISQHLMEILETTINQDLEKKIEIIKSSFKNDRWKIESKAVNFYLNNDAAEKIFNVIVNKISYISISNELFEKNLIGIVQTLSKPILDDLYKDESRILPIISWRLRRILHKLNIIKNREFPGKENFKNQLNETFSQIDPTSKAIIIENLIQNAKISLTSESDYLKTVEHFLGIVKYSLGQLHVKNNKHWKGLKILFESLNILQKYDNPVRISFVLHWIGKAMLGLSWKYDLDVAKKYLLKAQRLRLKCDHRYFLAYSELELGNFYKVKALKSSQSIEGRNTDSQKQLDLAENHFKSALSVFEELGKILSWGNALVQLGRCQTLRGDACKDQKIEDIEKKIYFYREAKKYFNRARTKFRALDPPNERKIRGVNFEIINVSKKELEVNNLLEDRKRDKKENLFVKGKETKWEKLENIPLSDYVNTLKGLKGANEIMEPLYLNEIGEYRFHSWLKKLVSEENPELKPWLTKFKKNNPGVLDIGIGDDAAVLNIEGEVVLTTDAAPGSICRSHKVEDGNYAAHFSVIHSISDLLAMGAKPAAVLLNMYLDRNATIEYAQEVLEVVTRKAGEYGALLVGGDIKERKTQSIGCVGIGIIPKGINPIKRSNAKAGQIVAISLARNRSEKELTKGRKIRKIGQRWAADVLEHLKHRFEPDSDLMKKLKEYNADPHIKQDLLFLADKEMLAGAATGKIQSAIDTSDGFMSCLEILGRESNVDFILEENLIEKIIADDVKEIARSLKRHNAQFLFNAGHDWEIVMTVNEDDFEEVQNAFRDEGGYLAPLGRVVEKVSGFQKEIGVYTRKKKIKKVPIFTDEKFVRESYEQRVSQWDDLDINYYLNHSQSIENIDYKEVKTFKKAH